MDLPDRPTPSLVRYWLEQWKANETFVLEDGALDLLFNTLCVGNTKLEHVLLKVCSLNDIYATHLYDTSRMARHVWRLGIDDRLARGDPGLVAEIGRLDFRGKVRNCYSFATKYCSHHRPEAYPIYDSYVARMLVLYCRGRSKPRTTGAALRSYPTFIESIEWFRTEFGVEEFTFREIDRFLWMYGKNFLRRS